MKLKILSFILVLFIFLFIHTPILTAKSHPKILLIGLDGADWKVINPLLKQNKLPHLKKIIENGTFGYLKSEDPLDSWVIWTTIATGKKPEEHGILNKFVPDPYSGEIILPTSNLIKVKRIWNIVSSLKKKAGVVGYLITWPPEEINGIMVSDRTNIYTKYLTKDYSSPAFVDFLSYQKFNELVSINDDSLMKIFSVTEKLDKEKQRRFYSLFKRISNNIISDIVTLNFADYLISNFDFDLFIVYERGTDALQHCFWKYLFPEGFTAIENDKELFKDLINDYYIYLDSFIGNLIKKAGDDVTVIVVSDHGFSSYEYSEYTFNINAILRNILMKPEIAEYQERIDFIIEQSCSLSPGKNIRISGLFTKEEFERLREILKRTLSEIEIIETGKKFIKPICDTNYGFVVELDMDYLIKNPLYRISLNGSEYKIADFLITKNQSSGTHDPLGIIIISGKNICQNKELPSATIYDITPTILYLMGLPVAKDMKGKVLVEAIEDKYLKRYPIRYIDTYEKEKIEKPSRPIRSPEDEAKIKEMMRSLGYIE
jgi:predicted AlkP superfamily phosphohydrolase/phosphomutase